MKKKILIASFFAIIMLLVPLSSVIGAPSNRINVDKQDVEPKEYLFQTIIDIANNPDVKDLLNCNYELFTSDYDFKSIFRQILFKKPMLFFSMLFTRPSITHKYIDTSYNRGCEITIILGEVKVIEIIESIEITNPEIFDNLNNIIMNNEELSNRIITLGEMNEMLKPDTPYENESIICSIFRLIVIGTLFSVFFLGDLIWEFEDYPIIAMMLRAIDIPLIAILFIFAAIYGKLNCPPIIF